MENLLIDLRAVITKFPQLKDEVNSMFQLCKDEIEEGGSYEHEIQLCYGAVKDLIDDIGEDSSFFY
jgi:hypothetical protein